MRARTIEAATPALPSHAGAADPIRPGVYSDNADNADDRSSQLRSVRGAAPVLSWRVPQTANQGADTDSADGVASVAGIDAAGQGAPRPDGWDTMPSSRIAGTGYVRRGKGVDSITRDEALRITRPGVAVLRRVSQAPPITERSAGSDSRPIRLDTGNDRSLIAFQPLLGVETWDGTRGALPRPLAQLPPAFPRPIADAPPSPTGAGPTIQAADVSPARLTFRAQPAPWATSLPTDG